MSSNCSLLGLDWCIVDYTFLGLSCLILFLTVTFTQILQYQRTSKMLFVIRRTQHLVFLGQIAQSLAMIVHYTFLGDSFNVIFLLQEYFMAVQYSLVFYYFIIQLIEAFNVLLGLYQVKIPLILLNVLMLTGFLIYVGIAAGLQYSLYTCDNGIWVYLHTWNLALSLIFAFIGCRANKALESMKESAKDTIDNEKIRQFW